MSIWKNRCNTCGNDQDFCGCHDEDEDYEETDAVAVAVLPKSIKVFPPGAEK